MSDKAGRTGVPAKVTELRFPAAGAGSYFRLLWLVALSLLCLGLGLLLLRLHQSSEPAGGFFSEVRGFLVIAIGAVMTLVTGFLAVAVPILNRRCWGQFGRPATVVDAAGVRFLLRGGTVLITGRDIAEIRLTRTNYTSRATGRRWSNTRVTLLLEPDADRVRDGLIRVPASRVLAVGRLEDVVLPDDCLDVTDVPADLAVSFLREIAGPLLVTTERGQKVGRTTALRYVTELRRAGRRRTAARRGVEPP